MSSVGVPAAGPVGHRCRMDGELGRLAASQGGFVYRWQALELGCRQTEIDTRLRHNEWVRVRRGAYAEQAEAAKLDAGGRHALVVRAAVGALSGQVVVTGHSALALLGVPLWGVQLDQVHVHRQVGKSSRREAGVVHHRGALPDSEVAELGDLLVAIPERAAVAACRASTFEAGVVVADGARRLGDFDLARAWEVVERERDWPGSGRAASALLFSDPRAATVGESRARVLLARIGVPKPDLQRTIVDDSGRLLGICDFYVDEYSSVVEFDGKLKYGRALYEQTGRIEDVDLGDVVWQEKRREDSFRDYGHEVARLVWSDLDGHDKQVRARLDRTFARGSRRTLTA
jgi:hypothetical protein